MARYLVMVDQNVHYEFDSDDPPEEILEAIESGDWPDTNNRVQKQRVQIYDLDHAVVPIVDQEG